MNTARLILGSIVGIAIVFLGLWATIGLGAATIGEAESKRDVTTFAAFIGVLIGLAVMVFGVYIVRAS
ncbi:MAG: hypothetical protein K2P84_03280 [Undibacterium sp.]|nr:hypothetical protein [Undibacterium sp.]